MNAQFSHRWLATLCRFLPAVHSAVFLVPDLENEQLRLLSRVPKNLDQYADFVAIAKNSLKKKEPRCFNNAQKIDGVSQDYFSYPVLLDSKLLGIIVIKLEHLPESRQKTVFNVIKQSTQWLNLASVSSLQSDDFYSRVVGLLAACFEQKSYHQGLIRMVTELTREFDCERVAFAEYRGHYSRVVAISNSASFDQRSNLMKKIAGAMDEAIEQDELIVLPENKAGLIRRAHQDLARKFGSGALCSIPLIHEKTIFGAVTLLRSEDKPFDQHTLDLCQQTLSLMTPFLALKRDEEKSLVYKIGGAFKKQLSQIFGFKFLKLKLLAIAAVSLISLMTLFEGDFRVTAEAILEGKIQRVIAAPISGYLLTASARAGDTVSQGDELASLDGSELELELNKRSGQLQKARREYREAQSSRDLVKVRVISEQINQTNAEIELTHRQLDNIRLTAPFDGIIIEGDLSQLMGSPVERGDSLFKIAPLEGYRIILKVKESEIAHVSVGQKGVLALSSMSERKLPLTVEKITAVAKADNGANIFRVEASLDNAPDILRPGMQGVGKINVGNARLIWIWTREITDWFRLWLWSWWP